MAITNDPADDRDLVARFLRRGDEGAFRTLFRRHTPALLQLARRLLGGAADGAEDVVQEVWLRAATRLGAFAWRSALRTWLCGIVVRCCHERMRAQGRTLAQSDESILVGRCDRVAAERVDLERALRALPDGYRAVLVLHEIEGWTHEAIAAHLEIQVGTSKSQLTRARRALRAYWAPAADPPEVMEQSDGRQ